MGYVEGKSASAAVVAVCKERKLELNSENLSEKSVRTFPTQNKKTKQKKRSANYKHTNYQYRSNVIFLKASKPKCKA